MWRSRARHDDRVCVLRLCPEYKSNHNHADIFANDYDTDHLGFYYDNADYISFDDVDANYVGVDYDGNDTNLRSE